MTTIGAAWLKYTESGKQFLACKIDEELLPLTLKKEHFLSLWEIPPEEQKENSPQYRIKISISQPQNK